MNVNLNQPASDLVGELSICGGDFSLGGDGWVLGDSGGAAGEDVESDDGGLSAVVL